MLTEQKVRVIVPTTSGPVDVLLLTEEDPQIGRSVACIGGTTETAEIAAAYHAFVVRPTGVVESLFGHPCYRLDVSGRIDAGSSWQLGVLAAHALHAAGRLAEENDPAGMVLWATGSVRPVDLTVGAVSHVCEKLASSMARLEAEAAAGRRVLLVIPQQGAADVSADVAAELAARGIEVIAVSHVGTLWDKLGIVPPARVGSANRRPEVTLRRYAAERRWTRSLLAAAAAAVLCLTAAVYVFVGPRIATGPASPTASPRAASAEMPLPAATRTVERLVPEAVPFISDRDRATVRELYEPGPDYKALAVSASFMAFITGQPDRATAEAAAMSRCQKIGEERRARGREGATECDLYASGNAVVFARGHPPMPPQPWTRPDPSIETPFAAQTLPFVSEAGRAILERGFARDAGPKALAISPNGHFSYYARETDAGQASRRALERCGYRAGVACMIVAVDDKFVVPIPKLMKIVGFARTGALLERIAPESREDVSRRLSSQPQGWSAVAVGVRGRAGLALDAGSEERAIALATADCERRDANCGVAAIGPFHVAPLEQ
jgi:hypothetical protein